MKSFTAGIVILTLALMSSLQGASSIKPKWCDKACYDDLWVATGEVPEKLAEVPPLPLFIGYNGRTILPNDTVSTDEMLDWPTLRWEEELLFRNLHRYI